MAKKAAKAKVIPNLAITEDDINLLQFIAEKTDTDGFAYIDPANSVSLANENFIEINNNMRDNKGGCATRINENGKAYLMAKGSKTVENKVSVRDEVSSFAIASFDAGNVIKKDGKRRGRSAKYPFDNLEVNQYFFVPASETMPNPVESLSGTVQAASKRFATPTGETKTIKRKPKGGSEAVEKQVPIMAYSRKFAVRGYIQNGVNGAAVVRIA